MHEAGGSSLKMDQVPRLRTRVFSTARILLERLVAVGEGTRSWRALLRRFYLAYPDLDDSWTWCFHLTSFRAYTGGIGSFMMLLAG